MFVFASQLPNEFDKLSKEGKAKAKNLTFFHLCYRADISYMNVTDNKIRSANRVSPSPALICRGPNKCIAAWNPD